MLRKRLTNHHILTAAFTFMACGTFTFIFSLMWLWDTVQVAEPKVWIRGPELAVFAAGMLYGLWRMWVEIR